MHMSYMFCGCSSLINIKVDENIIFNRLNSRIMQLFPQISYGEDFRQKIKALVKENNKKKDGNITGNTW